jgi:hypothetical protein
MKTANSVGTNTALRIDRPASAAITVNTLRRAIIVPWRELGMPMNAGRKLMF